MRLGSSRGLDLTRARLLALDITYSVSYLNAADEGSRKPFLL